MTAGGSESATANLLEKLRDLQQEESVVQRELIRHEAQRYEMCDGKDGSAVPCCDLSKSKLVCAYNRAGGAAKTAELTERIEGLLRERKLIFDELAATYSLKRRDIEMREEAVFDQYIAMELLEKDLAKARDSLRHTTAKRDNSIREAQIGSYYSESYEFYKGIARSVALLAFTFLVFTLAITFSPALFQTPLWYGRMLVSVIQVPSILYKLWELSLRDNMNFNQYDFGEPTSETGPSVFAADAQALGLGDGDNIKSLVGGTAGTCIGSDCCAEGLLYDPDRHVCTQAKRTASSHAADDQNLIIEGFDTLGPRG